MDLAKMVKRGCLEYLDLGYNQLGSSGANMLFIALKEKNGLKQLFIEQNGIQPNVVLQNTLNECFKRNSSLWYLSMNENPLKPKFFEGVCEGVRMNSTLQYLELRGIMEPKDVNSFKRRSRLNLNVVY